MSMRADHRQEPDPNWDFPLERAELDADFAVPHWWPAEFHWAGGFDCCAIGAHLPRSTLEAGPVLESSVVRRLLVPAGR